MTDQLDIVLRDGTPDDVAFIFSSWIKSYAASDVARSMDRRVYDAEQHDAIEAALARSRVIIACLASAPESIFGYAVVENDHTLHYVYVKQTYRRLGVARALLGALLDGPTTYTHRSARDITVPKGWVFNPYRFHRRSVAA